MRSFVPAFKDDKDRIITLGMLICSMFFLFFPALIVIFLPKEHMSETTYNIAKTLFNFELFLFLVSLLFMVPIIGWIVGFIVAPILMIWNIVVIVIAMCAMAGNNEIKLPELYRFI